MAETKFAIGVDLGGTKIEMALVDKKGQASNNIKIPTNVLGGYTTIEKDIFQNVEELKKSAKGPIFGIGIGAPGQIDAHDGSIRFAPNLKWTNVPLKTNLEKLLKLPVAITNDVRAAAWGEWLHGAGQGSQDIVCLFIGTGIGGGIVSGGQMIQGFNNSAGELGHMIVQMEGPTCTCGNKGCLEAIASGWALAKRGKELIRNNHAQGKNILNKAGGIMENVNAKFIVEAYKERDPLATQVVQAMFDALAAGCINIANTLNPERLILGGGVIVNLPELFDFLKKEVQKRALKSASSGLEILPAKLTKDAGVIGAGTLAWNVL